MLKISLVVVDGFLFLVLSVFAFWCWPMLYMHTHLRLSYLPDDSVVVFFCRFSLCLKVYFVWQEYDHTSFLMISVYMMYLFPFPSSVCVLIYIYIYIYYFFLVCLYLEQVSCKQCIAGSCFLSILTRISASFY